MKTSIGLGRGSLFFLFLLAFLSLLGACTRELSLSGRRCPCAEKQGWFCCRPTDRCVRSVYQCELTPPDGGTGGSDATDAPGPDQADSPPVICPMPAEPHEEPPEGSPIDTVIEPALCGGLEGADRGVDKYAPGYTPDKRVLSLVQSTVGVMSLADLAAQMRGVTITNINDIQRGEDTATIRGFRYRDASRGMNLGEDVSGNYPHAEKVGNSFVGYSTAFPVSMARGAAFDLELEYAIGEAIGDELQAADETVLLAPCMNILRNPLWGRAQESYGEDPYLTGRLASAMTVGIQRHVLAAAKHFLGYDIENNRSSSNSVMDEQTLREVYGRHFRMVVQDGGVGAMMAAYNSVNGVKVTLNKHLLVDVLRHDFGFRGFVLSDWWALPNSNYGAFKPVPDEILNATAVKAVKAGLDVELPWALNYRNLENLVGVPTGLLTADLVEAASRILEQKLRFNAQNLKSPHGLGSPQTRYVDSKIVCDGEHAALAKRAALESMVLLKNENGTLPIKSAKKVAVLGATVPYLVTDGPSSIGVRGLNFATDVLTGDSGSSRVFHNPANAISPLLGIQAAAPEGVEVQPGISVADAQDADFVVVVAGLTPQDEGEEYTLAGDRSSLALDAKQTDLAYRNKQNNLIASVIGLGKPMVVVLEGGSVIDMPWLADVPAVVMAWYPGQGGGEALGQLLWGSVRGKTYNFSGKLPFTWAKQLGDYPQFNGATDPTMGGDTVFDYYVGYRYFDHLGIAPLYPFGHGLSYTTFAYRKLQLGCSELSQGAVLPVVVNVANTGDLPGDETVLVFASFPNTQARRPDKELKGFTRVHLEPGEEKQVTIPVRLSDLDYFQMDAPNATSGKWVVESGGVKISVGGSSDFLPLVGTVNVHGYESAHLD